MQIRQCYECYLGMSMNANEEILLMIATSVILGTSWMSWSLVGSLVLGFVFLFLFPARYSRTDIDIRVQVQDDSENAENKATKPSVTERTTIYN